MSAKLQTSPVISTDSLTAGLRLPELYKASKNDTSEICYVEKIHIMYYIDIHKLNEIRNIQSINIPERTPPPPLISTWSFPSHYFYILKFLQINHYSASGRSHFLKYEVVRKVNHIGFLQNYLGKFISIPRILNIWPKESNLENFSQWLIIKASE